MFVENLKLNVMNKEYAIEILESVECGTLESNCRLAKEAYRYLMKLKSTDDSLYNRVCYLKNKAQ